MTIVKNTDDRGAFDCQDIDEFASHSRNDEGRLKSRALAPKFSDHIAEK
jgi:hypothetical protein